jgi:capsule polysaccharide modification protein KpsS
MSQHRVIFATPTIKLVQFHPDKRGVIDYATVIQVLAQEFPGVSADRIKLVVQSGSFLQASIERP